MATQLHHDHQVDADHRQNRHIGRLIFAVLVLAALAYAAYAAYATLNYPNTNRLDMDNQRAITAPDTTNPNSTNNTNQVTQPPRD